MGITTSGYDNYVYILPSGSCGWAGLGMIGSGQSWIAGNFCSWADVSAHELGHNFGMHHARSAGAEYGDVSDIMGYGGYGLRMLNGPHMDYMGWVPSTKTIIAGAGTYDLAPLAESASATSLPLLIKVKNPTTSGYYYFSLRQQIGYDVYMSSSYANRLNIHTSSGGYTDFLSALATGESFVDAASGIRVVVNSVTAASVNFTVSGECVANAPLVSISPSIQSAQAGQTKNYAVQVTNRDGGFCNSSQFNMQTVLPSSLTSTSSVTGLTLAAGESGSLNFSITSAVGTASGALSFSVNIADQANSAAHNSSASAQYFVDTVAPSVPAGLTLNASKGKAVKFSWSPSSDNVSVVNYRVYRNSVFIGNTSANSFSQNVGRGTYIYQVQAEDGAGNLSGLSAGLTVKK